MSSVNLDWNTIASSAISLTAALVWIDAIRAIAEAIKPPSPTRAAVYLVIYAILFTMVAILIIYIVNYEDEGEVPKQLVALYSIHSDSRVNDK